MDFEYLHKISKETTKEYYQDYQNKIVNRLFPLESVIEIEIQDMKQSIGQKVYGKMYNKYTISMAQHKYMEGVLNYYVGIAIKKGLVFARKH